eukprot:6568857-Ditylum_brightwellii.AAC.1
MDAQIKWTMTDDYGKFNIWVALIAIFGKIQTVDNRTHVKSNITNYIWKDLSDIPTGAEFSKAYNVQQEQWETAQQKFKCISSSYLT